ncbi:MAG: permease [Verrucomicrobiae bacterium]|nr:permease [Verrucomicrobiae bacterium]
MEILSDWGLRYLAALIELVRELWLFFAVGFLIAGLIAEFVPKETLMRYWGRNDLATLARSLAAGLVASLCSCGAIPIAATLRDKGATRAAALTFLAAAPWAGFVQLLVFYRFLGWGRTLLVFSGAMLVALGIGAVIGWLETRGWLDDRSRAPASCACADESEQSESHRATLWHRLGRALREAGEAAWSLGKYLAIGLLITAALRAFVPHDWVSRYLGGNGVIAPVLLAVPVAAVVELCSESFSIMGGQLYELGASLGVVFVVVLVGVTTDWTELAMIWGKFGRRSAIAYVITGTVLTVLLGLALHQLR